MKYVISEELEYDWTKWAKEDDLPSWERLLGQIYMMCYGISVNFHPKSDEEHNDLAHEAFVQTIAKIKDGRLTFDDRAPAFNLLTTTIFRHLYSLKNRDSRRKVAYNKLAQRTLNDPKVRRQLSVAQFNQALGSLSSIQELPLEQTK
jgi:DNA-directed RNA polymerase specialized sigma24 family protein